MKRFLSLFCALAFLSLLLMAVLPVSAAADNEWRKISYRLNPLTEGEEEMVGELANETRIPRDCTLWFDGERATVTVNGSEIQPGHELFWAGNYELNIINKANADQKLIYTITVLPNVNVEPGQVFTSYPTITCTNARQMYHMQDMTQRPLQSGETIRALGKHSLIFYIDDVSGFPVKIQQDFYIKAVHVLHVVNERQSGMNALDVIVGSFDDKEIKATLDGARELTEGSNIVTDVGRHTLFVLINGEEATLQQALPDRTELSLQIDLAFDELESETPYSFDFTHWDADIYLDGKRVEGIVRVGQHGKHTLVAKRADGTVIEDAFIVTVDGGEETAATEVTFAFKNPHLLYVIFVAVPAVVLLGFALYYLVARRRIV